MPGRQALASSPAKAHDAAMAEVIQPIPKRWWWTKRLLPICVAFLVASGAARWLWGRRADSQLQAAIKTIHTHNEPLLAAEFQEPPVPADQNAVTLYRQAGDIALLRAVPLGLARATPKERRLARLASMVVGPGTPMFYPAFRHAHPKELQAILSASARAFQLAREARTRPGVNWGLDLSHGLLGMTPFPLGRARNLARLLCFGALAAHEAGNDAEAVERLRDVVPLANATERIPALVSHLVAVSIGATMASTIAQIAPNLKIGTRPGEASPDAMRGLLSRMLNERPLWAGLELAFEGERGFEFEMCQDFIGSFFGANPGPLPVSFPGGRPGFAARLWWNYTTGPMWRLDQLRLVRRSTRYVLAAQARRFPAVQKALPPEFHRPTGLRVAAQLLSSLLTPAIGGSFVLHYRMVADWRLATEALAIRWYQVDHGHRPATLAELTPRYLPTVLADPFSADPKATLRYAPHAPRPAVYSVGENGVDDGGSFQVDARGWYDWGISKDVVFFLDGPRPSGPVDWTDPTSRPSWPGGLPRLGRPEARAAPTSATAPSAATSSRPTPQGSP